MNCLLGEWWCIQLKSIDEALAKWLKISLSINEYILFQCLFKWTELKGKQFLEQLEWFFFSTQPKDDVLFT